MSAGLWQLLLAVSAFLATAAAQETGAAPMVPALFVFGDSLLDSGNNNNLASLAKANYLPYGIDFAAGPTGRFCNGYTIVDELAELLGLPLVPAYSEASGSGQQLLQGVNYASAAAGILDESGGNFVGRIPFNQQIQNFELTVGQIAGSAAASIVARSIVFVGMGSNDYLNNYIMPNYETRRHYTPQQFADLLVTQYASQLTRLYKAGARRFVVAGVGSMGCIPTILARSAEGRCSEEVDQLVAPFNAGVRGMLDGLNAGLPGATFTYLDNHRLFKLMLAHPASYGFDVVDRGCCGIDRNGGQMTCLPFMPPCADRDRYLFWDAYHPTAAVNVIMARQAFDGASDVVSPVNVRRLAQL
ncbi:hypothetical protein CFC21_098250 [Triticum aestivum]|uniref:GDSL esterase/lipase n=3 Tax=Triticum TaxID=4564 RepID=A0A9R1BPP3_TRITD|nr:GDSL esterase/lipase At1g71691-like [Triticum aestivum]KAF7096279.1 hypothetical protein CFC21_098250 [Triticum aestivum]VAI76387.1 unnamed protein product [Triticum turgidum subsp. durum]